MKELYRKGTSIKLKCETDIDWKEMVQILHVNFLSGLPNYKLKPILLQLKNGVFTVNLRKAKEMHWVYE